MWLHRSMSATLVEGVSGLHVLEASGKHRDPAFWGHGDRDSYNVGPAEYDLVLGESLGVLQQDATPMCGGVIILSGTAALESSTSDLLHQPQDLSIRKAGLSSKTAEPRRRWEARSTAMPWPRTSSGRPDGDTPSPTTRSMGMATGHGSSPSTFNADEVEEASTSSATPPTSCKAAGNSISPPKEAKQHTLSTANRRPKQRRGPWVIRQHHVDSVSAGQRRWGIDSDARAL